MVQFIYLHKYLLIKYITVLLIGCAVCCLRDAVVGALMPASMILPAECPPSSPVPPLDSSSSSCVSDEEGPPVDPETEDRVSPNPWQDKKGEVQFSSFFYSGLCFDWAAVIDAV